MRLPETPMRLPDWKTCAGYLAVVAALALSLPGVRAVRADDEVAVISDDEVAVISDDGVAVISDDEVAVISVDLVDSGLTCNPNPEPAGSARVLLGDAPDRSGDSPPIALNTQGYSYRPPAVDPEARRLEQR